MGEKILQKIGTTVEVADVNSVKTFNTILSREDRQKMNLPEEVMIYNFQTREVTHPPTLIEKEINEGGFIDQDTADILVTQLDRIDSAMAISAIQQFDLDPEHHGYPSVINE